MSSLLWRMQFSGCIESLRWRWAEYVRTEHGSRPSAGCSRFDDGANLYGEALAPHPAANLLRELPSDAGQFGLSRRVQGLYNAEDDIHGGI